ncbi:D-ribose pyranase [Halobacillus shinanisalinarum]|uniref:D-ribose pyranase n=1 Tax=Halobacillus shinanisalinarum TaxID=2932258 RepID=A0ABY4H387_9BACI|nr:D-ribose pyranase [Halobacillus shinanisalinarum]UOQ94824.1 D-ribose pyranase [Halobacillus shinanisalinarum]
MKKTGILNRELASILARLGHTDTIIIADCGMPIPEDTKCVDLSVTLGSPSFESILQVIADDMEIEAITLAEEMKQHNASIHDNVLSYSKSIHYTSHEDLKTQAKNAKAVIRTGENTPYANAILQSGVIF